MAHGCFGDLHCCGYLNRACAFFDAIKVICDGEMGRMHTIRQGIGQHGCRQLIDDADFSKKGEYLCRICLFRGLVWCHLRIIQLIFVKYGIVLR